MDSHENLTFQFRDLPYDIAKKLNDKISKLYDEKMTEKERIKLIMDEVNKVREEIKETK